MEKVETKGRLPFVRGSIRVDQQAKLDASEFEVPAVNGHIRRLVVAGLINPAMRLCLFFPSVSTHPHPPQVFRSTGMEWAGRAIFFNV